MQIASCFFLRPEFLDLPYLSQACSPELFQSFCLDYLDWKKTVVLRVYFPHSFIFFLPLCFIFGTCAVSDCMSEQKDCFITGINKVMKGFFV